MTATTIPLRHQRDPITRAAKFLARYMLNDADHLRLAAGQTYREALAQVTGHAEPYAANETADVFGRIVRRFTDTAIAHLQKARKLPSDAIDAIEIELIEAAWVGMKRFADETLWAAR
jgi:hypothetical protein